MLNRSLLTAAVLLMSGTVDAAQTYNQYAVGQVVVDVVADTNTAAREQAFADGRQQAVQRLLDQIGASAQGIRAEDFTDAERTRMLQGLRIQREYSVGNRYRAELTYYFLPTEVDRLVAAHSGGSAAGADPGVVPATLPPDLSQAPPAVPVQPRAADATLVLPVYRGPRGNVLWDAPNPWLDAWRQGDEPNGPLILPAGDAADTAAIDADAALAGNAADFQPLAARYQAAQVVVPVAQWDGSAVTVVINSYREGMPARADILSVPGTDPRPALFREAMLQVRSRLAADRGEGTLFAAVPPPIPAAAQPAAAQPAAGAPEAPPLPSARIITQVPLPLARPAPPTGPALGIGRDVATVVVPLNGADDWFSIRDALARTEAVTATRTISLSPSRAIVEVRFHGAADALRRSLATQGLALDDGPDGPELRRP